MADVNAILDQIKSLTLLEASQLVKGIEEAFGVSAAAAAVAAAPAAGGGAAAAAPVGREDRVHGCSHRCRRKQDQRHQGGSRSHQPRSEGSQGSGGRRSQDHQGRRQQGRSRDHPEEVRRCRRNCRSKVVTSFSSRRRTWVTHAPPLFLLKLQQHHALAWQASGLRRKLADPAVGPGNRRMCGPSRTPTR